MTTPCGLHTQSAIHVEYRAHLFAEAWLLLYCMTVVADRCSSPFLTQCGRCLGLLMPLPVDGACCVPLHSDPPCFATDLRLPVVGEAGSLHHVQDHAEELGLSLHVQYDQMRQKNPDVHIRNETAI